MPPVYAQNVINNRLQQVQNAIDAAGAGFPGVVELLAGGSLVAAIPLAGPPSGTVASGVLTFFAPQTILSATGSGLVDSAQILDGFGNTVVTGLTAGSDFTCTPASITATESVSLVVATITGN